MHRLEENIGAGNVKLMPGDLRAIDSALSGIEVQGARYPEHFQRLVGRRAGLSAVVCARAFRVQT